MCNDDERPDNEQTDDEEPDKDVDPIEFVNLAEAEKMPTEPDEPDDGE